MKSMKLILLISSVVFLAGCNSQVADFVDAAKRGRTETTTPTVPTTQTSSVMGFKISPGKINTTTTNNGAISAVITPTNRKYVMGGDMAMTMTLSKSRTNPQ